MVELVPELRGLVLALNSSALFGGIAVGGFIAGQVVPSMGLMRLPLVSIGLAALSLLLLWLSMRMRAKRSQFAARVDMMATPNT